jgi:hypothetical protein
MYSNRVGIADHTPYRNDASQKYSRSDSETQPPGDGKLGDICGWTRFLHWDMLGLGRLYGFAAVDVRAARLIAAT